MCCAIYTRKSTEEGLEQEFNSLDAQREAAEAFILSQRSEGWLALPDRYDDGGFTGANMDRPALTRLLDDIKAGRVDCVVVYKVDRLSRSLLDFARIIGVFEAHGVSFVSVTQQFNTATSVGRLMLNVLLSFAQFEREMIAERTRDKIAAARRKGKWTGGTPVLGYEVDPEGGRLVVIPEEAERVRAIFGFYIARRSPLAVIQELDRRGWRTKLHVSRKGRASGGRPFTKAALRCLLRNPLYAGKVRSRDSVCPGEHEALVDEAVWERVQHLVSRNGNGHARAASSRNGHDPLLKGLLRCGPCGAAMTHAVTWRRGRPYRYYVCLNAQKRGWDACPTKSVRADEIEASVVERLRSLPLNGGRPQADAEGGPTQVGLPATDGTAHAPSLLGTIWDTLSPRERHRALRLVLERVAYDGSTGGLTASIRPSGIEALCRSVGSARREERP
ncbi:MAG: recombinase family protein [Planctomycetes bacterium]|nr:recombinase family protein [Planctomycetota bacterium]